MLSATINREVVLEGRGIFSGLPCRAVIHPALAGQGIVFVAAGTIIQATPAHYLATANCSTLANGGACVAVTEHLLAALWAAGIDTAVVEVTGPELPNRDGSALWQYEELIAAGRTEFAERQPLVIDRPITIGNAQSFIIYTPGDSLEATYLFEHPEIGQQTFVGELDRDYAASDILPARSFITEKEAAQAVAAGLLQNDNEEDGLVIRQRRPNRPLRFADEYARHKVLDLLGDLYAVPFELTGRIAAVRSGHRLNQELAAKLVERHQQVSRASF